MYGAFVYIDKLHIIDVEAEDIPIATWNLRLCVPIGFALLVMRLLEMGWRILTGQSPGYELADEAAEAIVELPTNTEQAIRGCDEHGFSVRLFVRLPDHRHAGRISLGLASVLTILFSSTTAWRRCR